MVVIQALPDCPNAYLPVADVACLVCGVQPKASTRTCFHHGMKEPSRALRWTVSERSGFTSQAYRFPLQTSDNAETAL